MRARIHRGAAEVGGNCVELESDGDRLVLDLGRPLWAEGDDEIPLPAVSGLSEGWDPALHGVLISHGHPDHYGLVDRLPAGVPVYASEVMTRILNAASFFTGAKPLDPAGFLVADRALELGPFKITPYLVDHSAYGAFAFLIAAGASEAAIAAIGGVQPGGLLLARQPPPPRSIAAPSASPSSERTSSRLRAAAATERAAKWPLLLMRAVRRDHGVDCELEVGVEFLVGWVAVGVGAAQLADSEVQRVGQAGLAGRLACGQAEIAVEPL